MINAWVSRDIVKKYKITGDMRITMQRAKPVKRWVIDKTDVN